MQPQEPSPWLPLVIFLSAGDKEGEMLLEIRTYCGVVNYVNNWKLIYKLRSRPPYFLQHF
jgi:hypothetical protein